MKPQLSALDNAAIAQIVNEAVEHIQAVQDSRGLGDLKREYLGDTSQIALANRAIRDLDPADRARAGQNLGSARSKIQQVFQLRLGEIEQQEKQQRLAAEHVDVTVPPSDIPQGARHPLSTITREISDLFTSMGWQVAEGPEVEHEWFNFDALNVDIDHPARGEQDTLYIDGRCLGGEQVGDGNLVLRTQTSPVQARVLLEQEPPVYMVCPGKVFRADELDQTHTPVFHQVEGLAVDKGITMAHLKGTLDYFAKSLFGEDARVRLRPSFFPFTEPSAEMDLWFPQKKGGAGWIEWGGCGMVNPNVLVACGIDPEVYSGFAFGMGIERALMLRHGIADMHDIVEGDIRFSKQFGTTGRGN
ncbi:MAG: phenylalanine--tRNA ligase subunit alpha [Varibaculum sp.]|nr:phenylalanine--tRNA ligase subunit alpha [Varibaculum sp.]